MSVYINRNIHQVGRTEQGRPSVLKRKSSVPRMRDFLSALPDLPDLVPVAGRLHGDPVLIIDRQTQLCRNVEFEVGTGGETPHDFGTFNRIT